MKIPANKYDVFVETVCLLGLVGILVYLGVLWPQIAEMVPAHYNAAGQIDRMAGKNTLLLLPIIGWILYIGMSVLARFPRAWNTGVTITDENRERVYRTLKNTLGTLKMAVVAAFAALTVYSSLGLNLPFWFLPGILILVLGLLFFFTARLMKESKAKNTES